MIVNIIDWIFIFALLLPVLYLFVFAAFSMQRRREPYPPARKRRRFVTLIPAYKADAVVVRTAQAALAQEYPEGLHRVAVIADQLQPATLGELRKLPLTVIEVTFENSSKAKALTAAVEELGPEAADAVAILDADKEGFLRNVRSLTQIAGRAARHSQGNVILYADTCTDSMRFAIEQSNRRREKQVRYNMEHGMLPRRAQKSGTGQSTLLSARTDVPEIAAAYPLAEDHYMAAADVQKTYVASENIDTLIDKAREDMERAAKSLDFLAAAKFRDRMYELQKLKEENRKG